MKAGKERAGEGIQEKIIDKAERQSKYNKVPRTINESVERQSKYNKVPRTINESVNSKTGIHSPDRLER